VDLLLDAEPGLVGHAQVEQNNVGRLGLSSREMTAPDIGLSTSLLAWHFNRIGGWRSAFLDVVGSPGKPPRAAPSAV